MAAVGLTTEKTGDLVSIWGQANVHNELDAVARVLSSALGRGFAAKLRPRGGDFDLRMR